jgi:hypothetical protein
LASDSSMFIFMFGIPTGDLNPIYNVPMLGTHKAALGNPLPAPCWILRVLTNLNMNRRAAPGSNYVFSGSEVIGFLRMVLMCMRSFLATAMSAV